MRRIGVRELRQHASRHLRDVQRGEALEVTDRGRPVARLVPVPSRGGVEELVASGRLAVGEGDLLELGQPLPLAEGKAPPSAALAGLRADER